MSKGIKHGDDTGHAPHHTVVDEDGSFGEVAEQRVQKIAIAESRKIGVTGAVFLILNKMIGTGSKCAIYYFLVWTYTAQFHPSLTACDIVFSTPSSVFAATGSVGVAIMLWVIGTHTPDTWFPTWNKGEVQNRLTYTDSIAQAAS